MLPKATPEDKQLGMMAHLLALLTGFLGPLILYFVKREESEFVGFHAGQAMYFELVSIPLTILTCGLWYIIKLIVNIQGIIRANNGEWDRIAVVWRWAWPPSLPIDEG